MDVGVIGVGTMGKNHVRVYSELKSVGHLGICDVNTGAVQAIAQQHGATAYPTVEALLAHVDAVSICVPTPFHAQVAAQVFAAKKHVFIEKPICATAAEAKTLMAGAPKGITIGVGHIERFNPIIAEIAKIVTKPLYVEMKRHNPASARVTGSSIIEDLMIHDIDIVLNVFFPKPCHIYSVGNADLCSVLMECGGVPVALSASRKASKKIRMIYIEEEDFTVEGDFMAQEVTIYRKPGQYQFENERYVQENIIEKVMVNKVEPLKVELSTFLDCARRHAPFPVTPEQAIRNLEVSEQIRAGFSAGIQA
ncbi:Gfo/Idh/MocA family oxidoreductase [Methanoregula sp.]|uniref:Gfo/Idh/MocA family oxidoreductase n=1 Tax=Methanoregula sp. TaxID=2052170 RepID=UPI002D0E367E|nr:Gfo/Idh/MocA family oxidoreductase [Methanoregula sp.]HVP95582.1 Gfo/Idh/MocA family oxidoreductase [Methanoregula sp.]